MSALNAELLFLNFYVCRCLFESEAFTTNTLEIMALVFQTVANQVLRCVILFNADLWLTALSRTVSRLDASCLSSPDICVTNCADKL